MKNIFNMHLKYIIYVILCMPILNFSVKAENTYDLYNYIAYNYINKLKYKNNIFIKYKFFSIKEIGNIIEVASNDGSERLLGEGFTLAPAFGPIVYINKYNNRVIGAIMMDNGRLTNKDEELIISKNLDIGNEILKYFNKINKNIILEDYKYFINKNDRIDIIYLYPIKKNIYNCKCGLLFFKEKSSIITEIPNR